DDTTTIKSCCHCGRDYTQTSATKRYGHYYLCDACGALPYPNGRRSKGILSPREQQVVRLISQGNGNKEIARKLHLTPATLKQHVFHLMQKLRLPNRTAVGVWWLGRHWSMFLEPRDLLRLGAQGIFRWSCGRGSAAYLRARPADCDAGPRSISVSA